MHHAAVTAARTVAQLTFFKEEDACAALGCPTRRGEAREAPTNDDPVNAGWQWFTRGRGDAARIRCVLMPGNGVPWSLRRINVLHEPRVACDGAVVAGRRV